MTHPGVLFGDVDEERSDEQWQLEDQVVLGLGDVPSRSVTRIYNRILEIGKGFSIYSVSLFIYKNLST